MLGGGGAEGGQSPDRAESECDDELCPESYESDDEPCAPPEVPAGVDDVPCLICDVSECRDDGAFFVILVLAISMTSCFVYRRFHPLRRLRQRRTPRLLPHRHAQR